LAGEVHGVPHGSTDALAVTVRYFAAAAEAAGREGEVIEFPPGATLHDLRELLADRYGARMRAVVDSGSFLLERVVRRDPGFPLAARVDVLPPFAGG
jgi:molybdopterin converting factor small subunit